MIKRGIRINFWLYMAAFFVPLGASVISVSVGPFQLSPFRICILGTIFWHLLKIGNKNKIRCMKKNTRYTMFFMIAWFVYSVLTFVWAMDTMAWFKNIYFLFIGLSTVVLFCSYITTIDSLRKLATAFELGILVQGVIGWYEILTKDYRFLEMTEANARYYLSGQHHVPVAMLDNPNNFATLMYCGMVIALFLYINEKMRRKKVFSLIMCINCALLLFLTTSRANILGVLVALGVFLLFGNKRKKAVLCFLLIVSLCIPKTTDYLNKILQFSFSDINGSESVRLNMIKTGLFYTVKSYGFGTGAGQVESWIATYGTPFYVGNYTSIHNWWIELISDYGIAVFIGYLLLYTKMMVTFKKSRDGGNGLITKTGLVFFAALAGYVVACISPSSMISQEWSWVFMALLIAYMSFLEKETRIKPIYRHILVAE